MMAYFVKTLQLLKGNFFPINGKVSFFFCFIKHTHTQIYSYLFIYLLMFMRERERCQSHLFSSVFRIKNVKIYRFLYNQIKNNFLKIDLMSALYN